MYVLHKQQSLFWEMQFLILVLLFFRFIKFLYSLDKIS